MTPTSLLDALALSPGWTYTIRTDKGPTWHISTAPGAFAVTDDATSPAHVTLTGPAEALLFDLWNRPAHKTNITGPSEAVALLRACVTIATQ